MVRSSDYMGEGTDKSAGRKGKTHAIERRQDRRGEVVIE